MIKCAIINTWKWIMHPLFTNDVGISKSSVKMSTYWEGKPPSSVLGVGEKVRMVDWKRCSLRILWLHSYVALPFLFSLFVSSLHHQIPSSVFGPLSALALVAGTYCIHESNIFHQLSSTTINPAYVLGSLLVPISWGAHVAAWIQKENGK